jgi:hypothetical protein
LRGSEWFFEDQRIEFGMFGFRIPWMPDSIGFSKECLVAWNRNYRVVSSYGKYLDGTLAVVCTWYQLPRITKPKNL